MIEGKYTRITKISARNVMMTTPVHILLIFVICWKTVYSTAFTPSGIGCSLDEHPCPSDQNRCGCKCYSSKDKICLGDTTICNIGEELCFRRCYAPESGAKCYNNYTLCQAGQEFCGYGCFDVNSGAECHNGVTLCQAHEENCGVGDDGCYDPKIEKCFDNKKVCGNNRQPCGSDRCYWPHNETCFLARKVYSTAWACTKGSELCGYTCFDSKDKTCLEYVIGNTSSEILCPVGSGLCGRNCYRLSNVTKCVQGILCPEDNEVCGKKCYTPSSEIACVKGVLCKTGEVACARKCYNSTTLGHKFYCRPKKSNETTDVPTLHSMATIEDNEEFVECDEGYEVNVNGDCQRILHFGYVPNQLAEDDDFEDDNNVTSATTLAVVCKFYNIVISLLSLHVLHNIYII